MQWDWSQIDFANYEGDTGDDNGFFLEVEQAHYWYKDGDERSADFEEPDKFRWMANFITFRRHDGEAPDYDWHKIAEGETTTLLEAKWRAQRAAERWQVQQDLYNEEAVHAAQMASDEEERRWREEEATSDQ